MTLAEKLPTEGKDILRLSPTWVPCSFCRPGKRMLLRDVIDWDANVDPNFKAKYFLPPKVIWENEYGCEEWICYKSPFVCAKRLTVKPGQSVVVKDMTAFKHFAENPELVIAG